MRVLILLLVALAIVGAVEYRTARHELSRFGCALTSAPDVLAAPDPADTYSCTKGADGR